MDINQIQVTMNLQEVNATNLAITLRDTFQTEDGTDLKVGHSEIAIKAVVKKIPVTLTEQFLKEIMKMVKKQVLDCKKGALLLKHFVQLNDVSLASEWCFREQLDSISGFLEEKISLQRHLFKLSGKLDLLTDKICLNENKNEEDEDQTLVNSVSEEIDSDFVDDFEDIEEERDWLEEEEENEQQIDIEENDSSMLNSSSEEIEVD